MSNNRNFMELLTEQLGHGRFLCPTLDSRFAQIPAQFKEECGGDPFETIVAFNRQIMWDTQSAACAWMADQNFYLEMGHEGLRALQKTIEVARTVANKVPFIVACYGGGVKHSAQALANYAYKYLEADAVVVDPWFGSEASEPLLCPQGKGVLVNARTSGPGRDELQEQLLANHEKVPLWKTAAHLASTLWNKNNNCGLYVGAAAYGEIRLMREVAPSMPIFVTGIGTQKAGLISAEDVEEVMVHGRNRQGTGAVICAARSLIFAPNVRAEAERLHRLIHECRAKCAA